MDFQLINPNTNRSQSSSSLELLEFGDYVSSACQKKRTVIVDTLNAFNGQVTYRFRHYPDIQSDQSLLAVVAAEAARRQGQFWAMYTALFTLSSITCYTLSELALNLGLDRQQFLHDLQDDSLYEIVKSDWQSGYQMGIRRTPTLFVGGQQFHGKLTLARLTPVIRFHLNRCDTPILSTVDQAKGIIHWSRGEFG